MSLNKQLKRGLKWTFIDTFFLRGFTFLVLLGLARLLTPGDFGLIGVISVFMIIGTAIIEGGMGNSIIRDNTATETDYSSVFYGNIVMSFLIYPIMYLVAPIIADYFNDKILTNLIRVSALNFIISAFFSIQHSVLTKKMMFKKITLFNLPAVIIGSFIGLFLAYYGYGVWSLVYMHLSTQLIKVVIYWSNSDWKPEARISFLKLKKHFLFGYKLMISSLLNSIMTEVYSFLIGKKFSLNTLGYYNQAKTLRDYPVGLISAVISKVTFPLLSEIQEDKKKVSETYKLILRSIFFIISPIMFFLMVVAKPLFLILLTEKWLPAVPYFQILLISGILIPIHTFNINIFKIYDRTDLFLKLEIVKFFMVFLSILFGIFFGIYALLISIVVISFVALFVNTYYSGNLISYTTLDQLKDMFPVVLISIITFILSFFLVNLLDYYHRIVVVVIIFFFFSVVYIGISYLINKKHFYEMKKILLLVLK